MRLIKLVHICLFLIIALTQPTQPQQLKGFYRVAQINLNAPKISSSVKIEDNNMIIQGCNWHTTAFTLDQTSQKFAIQKPFFSTQVSLDNVKEDAQILEAIKNAVKANKQNGIVIFRDLKDKVLLQIKQEDQNKFKIQQKDNVQKCSSLGEVRIDKRYKLSPQYKNSKTGSWNGTKQNKI